MSKVYYLDDETVVKHVTDWIKEADRDELESIYEDVFGVSSHYNTEAERYEVRTKKVTSDAYTEQLEKDAFEWQEEAKNE